MKRFMLPAILLAITAFSSFGAACVDGLLSAQPTAASCTVGNWTLSSFGVVNTDSSGYQGPITGDNFFVEFSSFTTAGGAEAFSVTITAAEGAESFMIASSGLPNQTATWASIFTIENGPLIQSITSSWSDVSVTAGDSANGSISLQKIIRNAELVGEPTINSATLLAVPGLLIPGLSTSLTIPVPNTISRLAVVDVVQIQSGNAGVAAVGSYTNTFAAAEPSGGEIPEPSTYLLYSGGLALIYLLRRRR